MTEFPSFDFEWPGIETTKDYPPERKFTTYLTEAAYAIGEELGFTIKDDEKMTKLALTAAIRAYGPSSLKWTDADYRQLSGFIHGLVSEIISEQRAIDKAAGEEVLKRTPTAWVGQDPRRGRRGGANANG